MIMENSSASAISDDEIQNNMNNGSCITDFHFSPALPSCNVFDMPPPPSPLSDPNLSDASFSSYMDDFNAFYYWFSDFNFETGTSESLPVAIQTDLQQPVSDSSSIPSSYIEAGAVADKPVVAAAEHEDRLQLVEGKEAEGNGGDHRIEAVVNPNDQNQAKKTVKPKKKNKPNQSSTKVTVKTETEVDHLDDGFRWRKYGQKRVKKSPFSRSYYRCTAPGCDVKKRIERYAPEPSMLLTSYEGNHTHLAPKVTPPAGLEIMPDANDAIAVGVQKIHDNLIKTNCVGVVGNQFEMSQSQPQQFQNQNQNVILQQPALPTLSYNNDYNNSFNIAPTMNVHSADNFPPLNVVNSSAAHNSPPLNVVNSSAAHNSPPLNVVNPTKNSINSSTTFSEFLQNLGGCNFSMSTQNLMSNDGLLQDMIKPMEMTEASVGAGLEQEQEQ